jgi:hypothetical protein
VLWPHSTLGFDLNPFLRGALVHNLAPSLDSRLIAWQLFLVTESQPHSRGNRR